MTRNPCRMTGIEFQEARKRIGLSQSELADRMETPKRTIQDWESGKSRIPGSTKLAMNFLLTEDQLIMEAIKQKIEQSMDRRFPRGFQSACCEDEETE